LEKEVSMLQHRVEHLEKLTCDQQTLIESLTSQLNQLHQQPDTFKTHSPSITESVNHLFSSKPTSLSSSFSFDISSSPLFVCLWEQLQNTYAVKAKRHSKKFAKWIYTHETLKELLIGFLVRI